MSKIIADMTEEDESRVFVRLLEVHATLRGLADRLRDKAVAYGETSEKNLPGNHVLT